MKWCKQGLIYAPSGKHWWARSYAHLPTAHLASENVLRVYYAGLDENKYGRIGYVDLDAENPQRVLAVCPEPILDVGEIGTFEDCGVVPSCVLERDGEVYCYYHGFQRTHRVPYMIFTGLARVSPTTGQLERLARTPILDRTHDEPFIRGAPFVLFEDGGFRMWYVSGVKWTSTNGHIHYQNVIRHAISHDGLNWTVDADPCLEPNLPEEYSVGRPCIVRDETGYHMWLAVRSHTEGYTISYAHSEDGRLWTRDDDQAGIGKSSEGWDSEIICYPYVIRAKNRWYMFYNGNGHGASGFGCAVLEG
jgi:predicted GH43/DUF377 family glycosyl hydrolase